MVQNQDAMPLISVCIPVYNSATYVEETLQSVINQQYQNIEILVQDNFSTDGTWEILQRFAKEHPPIRLERNAKNLGAVPNWNAVIKRANGDFVMFLGADDILEPGYLEKCLEIYQHKDVDVVTTNFNFYENGLKTPRNKPIDPGNYQYFASRLLRNPMLFNINFTLFSYETIQRMSVNGKLFARNLITSDYDLWMRLALSGAKVFYIADHLGSYRIHDSNMSRQKKRLRRQSAMVLLGHHKELKQCGWIYRLMLLRQIVRLFNPANYDKWLLRALRIALVK